MSISVSALILSGCGQMGPLYLPKDTQAQNSANTKANTVTQTSTNQEASTVNSNSSNSSKGN